MSDAEQLRQIEEWRRRSQLPAGDPQEMTLADYRDALRLLREGSRVAASLASDKKAAKSPKAKGDPDAKAASVLEGW